MKPKLRQNYGYLNDNICREITNRKVIGGEKLWRRYATIFHADLETLASQCLESQIDPTLIQTELWARNPALENLRAEHPFSSVFHFRMAV